MAHTVCTGPIDGRVGVAELDLERRAERESITPSDKERTTTATAAVQLSTA